MDDAGSPNCEDRNHARTNPLLLWQPSPTLERITPELYRGSPVCVCVYMCVGVCLCVHVCVCLFVLPQALHTNKHTYTLSRVNYFQLGEEK